MIKNEIFYLHSPAFEEHMLCVICFLFHLRRSSILVLPRNNTQKYVSGIVLYLKLYKQLLYKICLLWIYDLFVYNSVFFELDYLIAFLVIDYPFYLVFQPLLLVLVAIVSKHLNRKAQ